MKSGFVAVIGRPNVGKSTLVNAILNHKISIVTPKSQTTRDAIQGIYNDKDSQIVFVDTPGIHKTEIELGRIMNKVALESSKEVDAVILMVDAKFKYSSSDDYFLEGLKLNVPLFIVLNKIDLIHLEEAKALREFYEKKYPSAQIIEMVAKERFNVDILLREIKKILPEGPRYFPEEVLSDHDNIFIIKEIIREKILKLLKQEVPHNIAVEIDGFQRKKNECIIDATIVTAKDSQKGIVIGKGGTMLKKIGTLAREDIEKQERSHVILNLFVKVEENWLDDKEKLKGLGYK